MTLDVLYNISKSTLWLFSEIKKVIYWLAMQMVGPEFFTRLKNEIITLG